MTKETKIKELESVVVRFSGDSGDGMQLVGSLFSNLSAELGNNIVTFPDYPAEMRSAHGSLHGVSGYQMQIGASKVYTPGDKADVLVAMNPAALKINAPFLKPDSVVIIDSDSFLKEDLERALFKTDDPFAELGLASVQVVPAAITQILDYCQEMLNRPLAMLDGVEETLKKLSAEYKLVVATKGDLLDQERKIAASGLLKYLHHVEVMSDKNVKAYQKLIKYLGVKPAQFVMIGNSLKSDIQPVLEVGAHAVHIPHADTWVLEQIAQEDLKNKNFIVAENIKDLLKLF